MDTKIQGAGEMVGAWALHAGDHITVHEAADGSFEAVVRTIRDGHELDWESVDHQHAGCLHFSPADLVNRIYRNRAVA